jgi:NADP-dependent 3-hydroxy acid dehydrogenase YdfG
VTALEAMTALVTGATVAIATAGATALARDGARLLLMARRAFGLAGLESAWVTGQCLAVDGSNKLRRSPDLTPMVEAIYGKETIARLRNRKEA